MVVDRRINWEKMILAFFIAAFLFCIGLFLGYLAKGVIEGSTMSTEQGIRDEILSLETLSLLGQKYPCEAAATDTISDKLDYLGSLITMLETKKGKFDSEVLGLKRIYTIVQVRHMLLISERQEKCGGVYNVFQFFYSNTENCKESVDKTAFILTYLRNKYSSVRVYSFDVDLSSDVISSLMDRYKIEGCGSVVLNEQNLNGEFENSEDLEKLLKS